MKKNIKKLGTYSILLLSLFTIVPINANALTKKETVYSKIDSTGKVIKTTVNNELISDNQSDHLEDLTNLEEIINLSNDSTYTKNNNQITWNTSSTNLTYQGISNKELPISMNITYKLNNNVISSKDLLGKKGHIDISIKYTNNEKKFVYVNGVNTYLYTPFIITMGTIIKNDNATNLTITNGKIVNNGNANILVGLSAPGLYESLNIPELKSLDTITISYDTESFELPTIYNIATPKLLENDDLSIFNKLSNLTNVSASLKDNMSSIEEGSNKILEASTSINNGTNLLYQKVSLINEKIKEINTGAISLDNGLNDLINTLQEIKKSLNSDGDESIDKLKLLIETDLNTANNLKTINDTLKANYDSYNLKDITYENAITLDPTMNLYNLKLTYDTTYENNENLIKLLNSNVFALTETLTKLNNIDTEINTTKTEELSNGTNALSEGINILNTGIITYNNEGIIPLTNTINNSLSSNINKIKKLTELGNNYQTYTMKYANDSGETKFIIVLDGQKVKKTATKTEKKLKKITFIKHIKNLFK